MPQKESWSQRSNAQACGWISLVSQGPFSDISSSRTSRIYQVIDRLQTWFDRAGHGIVLSTPILSCPCHLRYSSQRATTNVRMGGLSQVHTQALSLHPPRLPHLCHRWLHPPLRPPATSKRRLRSKTALNF